MKDIKITKDNYKELFECAGFENYAKDIFRIKTNSCYLFLWHKSEEVTAWVSTEGTCAEISLNPTNNSTAEVDRLFYPFLDEPLVWEKKWDFWSVYDRLYKHSLSTTDNNLKIKREYAHPNPRVQAFSRLLLVMNALNKEYEGSDISICEVHIEEEELKVEYCVRKADVVGVFVLNNSTAADLFLLYNEVDLKTFFNI